MFRSDDLTAPRGRNTVKRMVLTVLCLFAAPAVHAQEAPKPPQRLSVETMFDPQARAQWAAVRWDRDGESHMAVEQPADGAGVDIVRYATQSNVRTVLVHARELIPAGATAPLSIEDFHWSADDRLLLIKTGSKKFRGGYPLGDFWLFDAAKRTLRKVGGDAPTSSLMYAELSPDGSAVAYVRDGDLYVEPTDGSAPRQLTTDGSDRVVNGIGDWVYEEEFGLSKAFAWSPDSRRIAYWRFDMSAVGEFPILRNTVSPYSLVSTVRYPKVGTANSTVKVGTVEVASGKTTWFSLPGDPAQNYVPQMGWAGGSQDVLVQLSNRRQNHYTVLLANAATGEARPVIEERDAAWIDHNPAPAWIRGGKAFLWISERGGWRQLYVVSHDGKRLDLRTPGKFDVLNIVSVDQAGGWVYFMASPDNGTQRHLYRAALNGKARVTRVSPARDRGWFLYDIAPGGRWAIENYSTYDTPATGRLIDLTGKTPPRVLQENAAAKAVLAANPLPPTEFVRIAIEPGVDLDAWVMKPADFDAAKKYPVLFYGYAEPFGTRVNDIWDGNFGWWHRMLAQQGYVVVAIDPRGTPQPRGRAWRKAQYGKVGTQSSADLAAATRRLLAERPYLDPARVGIWGWSGGGAMTMNALFRYPDLYKTGIAIAGPTDQTLYDTVYQERYMGLREDNADGYRDGSPITHADKLQGNLLLIHGTADDNVHYQHLEQLIDKLIAGNKQFTMMAYPDREHLISDPAARRHLFTLMTRYLDQNLKSVPAK